MAQFQLPQNLDHLDNEGLLHAVIQSPNLQAFHGHAGFRFEQSENGFAIDLDTIPVPRFYCTSRRRFTGYGDQGRRTIRQSPHGKWRHLYHFPGQQAPVQPQGHGRHNQSKFLWHDLEQPTWYVDEYYVQDNSPWVLLRFTRNYQPPLPNPQGEDDDPGNAQNEDPHDEAQGHQGDGDQEAQGEDNDDVNDDPNENDAGNAQDEDPHNEAQGNQGNGDEEGHGNLAQGFGQAHADFANQDQGHQDDAAANNENQEDGAAGQEDHGDQEDGFGQANNADFGGFEELFNQGNNQQADDEFTDDEWWDEDDAFADGQDGNNNAGQQPNPGHQDNGGNGNDQD